MRRHGSVCGQFVFPDTEDTDVYPNSAILKVLRSPKVDLYKVHNFSDDLSLYNGRLR